MRSLILGVALVFLGGCSTTSHFYGNGVGEVPTGTFHFKHIADEIPYDLFAALKLHPHYKGGLIIVPPWIKETEKDGNKPEEYRNQYKPTWEPLLRRI